MSVVGTATAITNNRANIAAGVFVQVSFSVLMEGVKQCHILLTNKLGCYSLADIAILAQRVHRTSCAWCASPQPSHIDMMSRRFHRYRLGKQCRILRKDIESLRRSGSVVVGGVGAVIEAYRTRLRQIGAHFSMN